MSKYNFFPIVIVMLLSNTCTVSAQKTYSVELWSIDSEIIDLDISKDGSRVVMINASGIYCFNACNRQLLWNKTDEGSIGSFHQVVTSADGGGTVVLVEVENDVYGIIYLNSTGHLRWYFIESIGELTPPQYGRLIDISDNGDYVTAALNIYIAGLGYAYDYYPCVLYWNESSTFYDPGSSRAYTWLDTFGIVDPNDGGEFNLTSCLDLSDDGSSLSIGTLNYNGSSSVFFYPDADYPGLSSIHEPTSGLSNLDSLVVDVDLSHDGYAAVAVTRGIEVNGATLYYWSNVPSLSEESPANWTRIHGFHCADISGTGDTVVAGTTSSMPCGVHYWDGTLAVNGVIDHHEKWARHTGEFIPDIAVSQSGEILAATAVTESHDFMVYFHDSTGASLGEYELGLGDLLLEMSGDGTMVAVGGGAMKSLHVFKLETPVVEPVGGVIVPKQKLLLPYQALVLIMILGKIAINKRTRRSY